MALLYCLVVHLLLACLCDGQASQVGPFSQLSSQESLLQPVQQAAQEQSSLVASEVAQRSPSLQLPQGVSSQQLSSMRLMQLDPLAQNSNLALPVEPVFVLPYSQPSVPVSLVQPPAQVPPAVKPQWLAAPSGVKVECREDSVVVEVQQDMLSNGQLIQPSEITLGGCVPVGRDPSRGVLLFVSELHGCGSTLMTMTNSLIYTFTLVYVPEGLGSTPIVRSHGAVINIECHYLRRINVSSNAVMPSWVPFSAALSAEERLVFSLQFMTDNWELERASNIYFLGDILNIEASVVVANHQPLRLFVDSCVATLEPDVTSVPRYAFVGNYGCLTDAKVTASRSQFLPRKQVNKLQMQLDAFRFSQETRSSIYITCILKATMASKRPDPQHKACSYSVLADRSVQLNVSSSVVDATERQWFPVHRWESADGDDQVCGCCDTSCNVKGRSVADFKGKAVAGPIAIQDHY
ncbi:zona pellucida sperm-binding protein 3-like isoform X1 [Scleropages formosus]|uniref:zona pellucida sperm-binding protein 3-like isoform X1 n=2 Tax=Scleropages formosus TaxID=113540 RepID=UPI0010FA945A|nr:zona pellucida sperm-binding protein 3-like isoform X1 [Scleropages formosus]XP_029107467.1 zona pellucida sperm-binding protein 3-like isoform X1 [Scleropages formosus]XP_029107487.1 zona pellucida sperm-binding protein 3-like isoform X1 [Scleropages formosus]XP_029108357.1 zona pellucida sperm-binding protein 3-like isoform X1 [Scleropages formosus]XP_029108387.1 zona pellucida sperm-binding protein 3-like isoform X1 [Scleropages formosus]XP_029108400.1 zona pellucida sperm-binding protei